MQKSSAKNAIKHIKLSIQLIDLLINIQYTFIRKINYLNQIVIKKIIKQ